MSPQAAAKPSPATTTILITYTYDPLYWLTKAEYSTGESYGYEYEEVGNRTALSTTEGTITYTYPCQDRRDR